MKPAISFALRTGPAPLVPAGPASAMGMRVGDDFQGGSARAESVEQAAPVQLFRQG